MRLPKEARKPPYSSGGSLVTELSPAPKGIGDLVGLGAATWGPDPKLAPLGLSFLPCDSNL